MEFTVTLDRLGRRVPPRSGVGRRAFGLCSPVEIRLEPRGDLDVADHPVEGEWVCGDERRDLVLGVGGDDDAAADQLAGLVDQSARRD